MAITFTDKKLYLKGTAVAFLTDKSTGNIVYFSDKFQTANVSTSVTMGEIRAGLGNAVAAYITSDAAVNVEFNAADFNLRAKALQTGAKLEYNAPVMVCQNVTASDASLTIDVSEGTPVAELGFSDVHCYVQEVGAAAPILTYGTAYALNATTGAISDFVATATKTYKVWYFVNKAGAQMATIGSMIDPAVMHFTAQMAVYANDGSAADEGTRVGSLYVIVPALKLGGNGGVNGDQTGNDTTSISGQAVVYDSSVISASCNECDASANALAYYIYVPCDGATDAQGLALVGGVLTVAKSTTHTISEFKLVMADGSLVTPDAANMAYVLTAAPNGTSVSGSVITAGATTGDCDITATYTDGAETYTCVGTLTIA